MSENLQAEYRITEDDYVRALRLHSWRDLVGRPVLLLACCVILIVLMLAIWSIPGGARVVLYHFQIIMTWRCTERT
jgi:hypothetical protein